MKFTCLILLVSSLIACSNQFISDPRIKWENLPFYERSVIWKKEESLNGKEKECVDSALSAYKKKAITHCQETGYAKNIAGGCYHVHGTINVSEIKASMESCSIETFQLPLNIIKWREYDSRYNKSEDDNSYDYERTTQKQLLSDSAFVTQCWERLAPLSFELYYSIDTNGQAFDVVWFPEAIDASCIKNKITSSKFPKPHNLVHSSWLITDDDS